MARTIIIDCDPGIDDAVALSMALAAKELDVVGITTVGGNVGVDMTTRNALRLTALAGKKIPIARGANQALVVPPHRAESIHGSDGLGGVHLAEGTYDEEPQRAYEFIRDTAKRLNGTLELVAIGPLTNLAITLRSYPEIIPLIRGIHIMGGSAGLGNASPAAEFNILADPHAAQMVFHAGIPITMCGLDVTNRATLSAMELEALKKIGGRVISPIGAMLDHYLSMYRSLGHQELALHDPLVIARLIDPHLVRLELCNVEVETQGQYTMGKTVVDLHHISGRPANAEVGVDLDREGVIKLMIALLRSYDH